MALIEPEASSSTSVLSADQIEAAIHLFRGQRVMLDADLARIYGTETGVLVQAVTRNLERFPPDFMFQLTAEEHAELRSRNEISSGWGGRRSRPYAFTEQGVAMLSSVLRSSRAVHANIEIMRAFVRHRSVLASSQDFVRRLDELEQRYDEQFQVVFDAIRELMTPPPAPPRRLGFRTSGA